MEFYVSTWTVGQSELAESPPRASVSVTRTVTDWRQRRRLTTTELRAVTGNPTRQRSVVAGGIGAQGSDALAAPMPANAVIAADRAMRFQPDRLLLAALDNPAALTALVPREFRGSMHDGVRLAGTDTVSLWFDRATGLLTATETRTDDSILGDRILLTYYTRWQSIGAGVRLPRQMDAFVNGQIVQHANYPVVAALTPDDSLFAIPDSIASRAQRTPPPPGIPAATIVQIAPNVWRAEGSTHHTLIIDQGDGLLLVEAPQSTQRVRMVLDSIARRFPGKRINGLVATHHHWDHTGGLREIIAEGITVYTHEANAAFVRRVGEARRTIAPDLQEQRRRGVTVRTMSDSMGIGAGAGRVVLYRTESMHAQGIISVWVPAAGVLFTSDVVNPTATTVPAAGSAELIALARARGITPTQYVGGHGRAVPWEEIARAAATAP
jgi:glyoxylase-like metal-dependent hydrolase (beta-lactamase superfamily II)